MSRNQLDPETSPFLLQHKDNPVHWRAWGPEALDEAQTTGKPILLSIGFSACHWCRVMNDESFQDPETAAMMNELFVNIIVDREERPDIDQIYQTAANAFGHTGGWPLTVFLTPTGEPFYVGTYLPKDERLGQPPFKRVMPEVIRTFRDDQEAITNTIARIHQTFSTLWSRDLRANFDRPILDVTAIAVGQRFDIFYGGLTGSTKFPTTGLVEMLWRAFLRTGLLQFPTLVQATLDHMCRGGLYDHIGGGFSHYTVEQRWLVPHFEKMLYDNAGIIDLLTLVWQHNRPPLYRDRIEDTIGWVLRDMMVESAFATSIDSDSEGEEGKYYVWSEAEIDAALAGTFSQRFKESYSVTRAGNYRGANILERTTAAYPLSDADEALLKKQRGLLLAARQKRVPPLRDDKILADWNGMMIAALANAGAVFRKPEWTAAAAGAFDFIVKALGDGDRLYHSWRAGTRGHIGFVDDYAHMARAAYMLWEATGERQYIAHAEKWVRALNEHFWDVQNGGYFYTADDSDPLIDRARMAFDQNMPSANGTMVALLARLFFVTADSSYRDRCNALIQAFSGEANRASISMGTYLNSLEVAALGLQIVILGPRANPKTQEFVSAVRGRSLPNLTLIVVDPSQPLPEGHPAASMTMQNGQPTAYIVKSAACSQPITNPVTLSQMLQLPPQAPAKRQGP
jgi:uncharacterized protein YyaL (SSP411 family)